MFRTDAQIAASRPIFSRINNKLLKIVLFIVRVAFITPFFLIMFLFPTMVFANIQYYGADVKLSANGKSSIKLTFTFSEPVDTFNFTVLGKIENLQASSIAGVVNCNVEFTGTSYVRCVLPLTEEKRGVDITYETQDFTKPLGEKFLFSGDFSLDQKIDQFTLSLTLPEGMALSDGERLSFADNSTKVSDGRHIIVVWKLDEIEGKSLVFQALYEPVQEMPSFIWYFIGGVAVIGIVAFFIIKKVRKPQEVILSVLDDYERNIMKTIAESGGEINQRKVVQHTNLSKAKVSRVVKTLEERGLIEVERLGRTNKLRLVKKKIWT